MYACMPTQVTMLGAFLTIEVRKKVTDVEDPTSVKALRVEKIYMSPEKKKISMAEVNIWEEWYAMK